MQYVARISCPSDCIPFVFSDSIQVTGSSLDPGAALLLLTPKPPASMHESLAANIAARCLKLQEEAAATKLEGLCSHVPAVCWRAFPVRRRPGHHHQPGPGSVQAVAWQRPRRRIGLPREHLPRSVWPKRESASGPSLVASQEAQKGPGRESFDLATMNSLLRVSLKAVQTSTGPLHRIVSQTPATPRAIETSMWQRITDWESFNVTRINCQVLPQSQILALQTKPRWIPG